MTARAQHRRRKIIRFEDERNGLRVQRFSLRGNDDARLKLFACPEQLSEVVGRPRERRHLISSTSFSLFLLISSIFLISSSVSF